MRQILTIAVLAITGFGQTAPFRITADDAAKHLVSGPQPAYPQLAEQARIQGNVILEMTIDESGSPRNIRLVSGHPMLVTAAIQAVSHWKYEPIQVDGKPVSVVTDVVVTFGDKKYYAPAARAELAFRYEFWTAEEGAEAAIAQKNYSAAEERLQRAKEVLGADTQHLLQRWQWLTTTGRLRASQQKYDQAEQYLKDALALASNGAKESQINALSLSNLGALFADEKKFDLAYQNRSQALSIYQKNFMEARDSTVKKILGQSVAEESLRLLQVAESQNNETERNTQCRTLDEFQGFLSPTQRASAEVVCPSLKPTQ